MKRYSGNDTSIEFPQKAKRRQLVRWGLLLAATASLSSLAFANSPDGTTQAASPAPPAPAPTPAPAGPATPTVKWRGALWASAASSDKQTADGSLFLRSLDAGNGNLALDGLQLGADVALPDGWAFKFTLLAGQTGKILNAGTLNSSGVAEAGSIAWPEAQLIWTGAADTFKIGRMYTAMGMEVMDHTQDITATRGILFTYAIPVAQVGVNWHHAFSGAWSSDVWVYNGEDRIQDNNQGKTAGLGLTYNHAGAADKFVTLMAFSGPEQNGLGASANTGAEGRKRNRVCLSGQWVWGKSTLQWEGESAQETLLTSPADQPRTTAKASWYGAGVIYKYQCNDRWAGFARAETLKDDKGIRLSTDTSVATALAGPLSGDPSLQATSFALGVERKWHNTFSRLEARLDSLNKDVTDDSNKTFKQAASVTWSFGTSF